MTREDLFYSWETMSIKVSLLKLIVQNPLENVTYQDYLEFQKLVNQIMVDVQELRDETTSLIYRDCHKRWKDNEEMTDV